MKYNNNNNGTLKIGDQVPAFSLKDQSGAAWDSGKELSGSISIIYFYPKDESGICTQQACAFRDSYTAFTDAGVKVIGINPASTESHKRFGLKNDLPFTLLSDPQNIVLKQFGVKNALFLTGRETFIFNKEGILIYKFRNFFKGGSHVEKALVFLDIIV